MTVRTSAGASLRVSASAPSTYNQTGFEAIFDASPTPAAVGEITDMGEFGRMYNMVKHSPISTRAVQNIKGSYEEGVMELSLGLDTSDAGQTILQTAANTDDFYSFKLEMQSGDVVYFVAQVGSWKITLGGVDSITSVKCTLSIRSVGGVGPIVVPA